MIKIISPVLSDHPRSNFQRSSTTVINHSFGEELGRVLLASVVQYKLELPISDIQAMPVVFGTCIKTQN